MPLFVSDFQYQMLPSGEKTVQGSELTLLNVSRLDSGTYFCRASNGVDRAVEANIKLKVICEWILGICRLAKKLRLTNLESTHRKLQFSFCY